mmetsp:Transcript_1082/g.1596  ORF Transcript_1082/g.1596 Transcript_1082/m.1596 type:complete len:1247 (+) Transcript_1082:162-3902(+)|eukprot:CAMPEP_0194237130 /NCGR_PEP_ID=MMETSP0158-20130606/4208_1 /TAXON_ID=33649 /ORGANISM="Thalassionema nitzschioides, Strain L26-B" /LENGTH=1246 /DNA_ID=CAMNT_0038971061 /DNA_START=101 /DNA_END=3841 /DNA_ORIENTATION=-
MTMDEDDKSFEEVLRELKSLSMKRDPRSVRLAAVTMAIIDVLKDDEIVPARVYSSTVTTLEGTLQQHSELGSNSLVTQVALLELLSRVIPHVSLNVLTATIAMTSRVLIGVVTSCRSITFDGDTKDELGGVNATLRASCRTTTQLVLSVGKSVQEKAIRQLLKGTIIPLWDDRRPKVRKAAQEGACEIVLNRSCGSLFTDFCLIEMDSGTTATVLHTLQWLQSTILHMNIEKLGGKIMELLLTTLEPPSKTGSDFIANFTNRQLQDRILLINGVLSLLVAIMEEQDMELDKKKQLQRDTFAARVLATLLQGKPSVIFFGNHSVDVSLLESGKGLYGKALLLTCQCVMNSEPTVAKKLLPLTVQRVVQLAKPEEGESIAVAEALMPELTKMLKHTDGADDLLNGIETVLQHSYRATWSVSLLPLATLLRRNQNIDVIRKLIQIHSFDTKPVEEAIGSIIQEVGLERFWDFISWEDCPEPNRKGKQNEIISTNEAWLLPVLKSFGSLSAVRPRMHFFQNTVLGLARECDKLAAVHKNKINKARVVDLWSLFECLCSGVPNDFSQLFPELVPTLLQAMGDKRYPKLVTIICGGLQSLAESIHDESDRQVLSQASKRLLPALFKLLEMLQENSTTPPKKSVQEEEMDIDDKDMPETVLSAADQRVAVVISAVSKLAFVAPSSYLENLLKKVLQRLLVASQSTEDESDKTFALLNLCQALAPATDETGVELIYRTIKPLIRSDEQPPRVQKRAYKVLLCICQSHTEFCTNLSRLSELTDLLVDGLVTCQVSARHMRLKCMAVIVKKFQSTDTHQMDIIPKILGEVLLCLKDSNGKTREAAYQLLISMANAMNCMESYLKIVAAALGALTPHMRSAAVLAMSRLVFEYAREDMAFQNMLPSMLQTVLVLFDETSREVIKSVIGFVRVSVAAMTEEQLEPLLPDVVGGLFKYHKAKDRFRAKIKIILKKLVRVYGYEKLMPFVPDSDTRLLTHMRKLSERAARRKQAERQDGKSEIVRFDEMMESDEEDSDDGRTLMTGATRFTELTGRTGKSVRKAAIEKSERRTLHSKNTSASTAVTNRSSAESARLKNEKDGNVHDLLDPAISNSVRFAPSDDDSQDDSSDGGVMEFDELGRLIVHDDLDEVSTRQQTTLDNEEEVDNLETVGHKRRKINKFENAKVAREEAQRKKSRSKALGAAYKSKKSGGDVKKKGQKFEPYAFVPLDGKSYTKNNRRKAIESMSTVVRNRGGKRKR